MAIFGLSYRAVALIGFGLFLAFYLDDSPMMITTELSNWINKGKYMVYRNHKIFYREEKNKMIDGSPIICIHGFPTFSYDWAKMFPSLATRFRHVIAPDLLGYGYSDKPSRHTYSILEQADIMEALMDHLLIKETHILAHDYGDTVAQELLARYEERLAKGIDGPRILSVTLLNGGIFPETNFPRFGQKLLLLPYINQLLVKLMNIYTFQRGLNEVFGPETQLDADDAGDFWATVVHNNGHVVLPRLLGYIEERKLNRARWVSILQTTEVPVHCIYGPADPVNPNPEFPDKFKETLSESHITVLDEKIGHYPQWEAPEETASAHFRFVKQANSIKRAENN